MPARRLLPALLLAAVVTRSARADGVPVGPVPTDDQSRPAVTADGHGGAVVTYKTASLKVGAVHLNGSGVPDGGLGFAPSTFPFALDAAILTLSAPARLEPGRYFARVSQGGESASTSVTVLR